jgi:putative restriction endonuclease
VSKTNIDATLSLSFDEYLFQNNLPGSNKANSYRRALELLDPILRTKGCEFQADHDIQAIQDPQRIRALYRFVLAQQKLGQDGIFKNEEPASYWRDGYFSAVLNQYLRYLELPEQLFIKKATEIFATPINVQEIEQLKHLDEEAVFDRLIEAIGIGSGNQEGRERLRLQKTRVNQSLFRKFTLLNYENQCCVSGLSIKPLLRASHILAWAESPEHRMNPENGLCLSATYDLAFDQHLISFDEDYRLVTSKTIRDHYSNEATKSYFMNFEGKSLIFPKRYQPNQTLLEKHRNRLK